MGGGGKTHPWVWPLVGWVAGAEGPFWVARTEVRLRSVGRVQASGGRTVSGLWAGEVAEAETKSLWGRERPLCCFYVQLAAVCPADGSQRALGELPRPTQQVWALPGSPEEARASVAPTRSSGTGGRQGTWA